MNGPVLLILGLTGQWLLGVAIADWLLGQDSVCVQSGPNGVRHFASSWTERVGLGFVLGIGTTAGILFLWSLCGGSLGREISLCITAVGFVGGGRVVYREFKRARKSANLPANSAEIQGISTEKSWCRCCQVLVFGLFVATLIQSLLTPQRLWDERASFAIKGIVLWEDHSVHSRDLADPDFVQFHPRYPLLIPLAEEHVYALLGTVDDRLAKAIFPLMYLGMVLTMAGGLMRQLTKGSAWFFALLLATIPALVPWEYGFPCGQADAPMACYHGTSVLYLWSAWERFSGENPVGWFRCAVLAGLCGAMAAFTKDEGIAFLLVDAIAMLLVLPIGRRRLHVMKVFLTIFGIAIALLLPWFLHRRGLPLTTEANYFGRASLATILQKRANLQWVIPHLISRMFGEFRDWGLQWWMAVFALIAAPRKMLACPQLVLLLDLIGSLLFLMLAGILSETEVSEHIGGSSHRYLMQIAPVAILLVAGQLGVRRDAGVEK